MVNYFEYTVRVYEDRTEWYLGDELHKLDGPAVEYTDGEKIWYKNGKLHRLDGPAIEHSNGNKSYFIEGYCFTEKEFNKRKNSYEGKIVEINGTQYKLSKVKE